MAENNTGFSFDAFEAANSDIFNPATVDDELNNTPEIEVTTTNLAYDKYIVLDRKDLMNFVKIVSTLTRQSVDQYGRCIYFDTSKGDVVTLKYSNIPFFATLDVSNKSGKTVRNFAVSVATLTKLLSQGFSAMVFVEDEEKNINIAACESLLYLDTVELSEDGYVHENIDATEELNKDTASYVFKTLGSALSLTDRTSEKNIVISDGRAHFTTGAFVATAPSPFTGDSSFILYRTVVDIISSIVEISSSKLYYTISDDLIIVTDKSGLYVELVIGQSNLVPKYLSPTASMQLQFTSDVTLVNDQLLRLISIVSALEYFSNTAEITFNGDRMTITFEAASAGRKSSYNFKTVSGAFKDGSMKVSLATLKLLLNLMSSDCKYTYTDNGLGIEAPTAKMLIRKL